MSELADETDSKSVIRKGVWVQVPPPAPTECLGAQMRNRGAFFYILFFSVSATTFRPLTSKLPNLYGSGVNYCKKIVADDKISATTWLGWRDSNSRMQQSKCCVLPLDDTPILSFVKKIPPLYGSNGQFGNSTASVP